MKSDTQYYDNHIFFPNLFGCYTIDGVLSDKFADTDSPDLFQQSKNKKSADWIYHTKEISYAANSNGYRAPEWHMIDWASAVVIFGCSCTAGIGLAEDETVSHHLSKLINRPVINLGSGGSSMQYSFLNSLNIIEKGLPIPYAVVQNWTTMERTVIFEKMRARHYGPWDRADRFYNAYSRHDSNLQITTRYTSIASAAVWKPLTRYVSASFFSNTAHDTSSKFCKLETDARDLLHPGNNSAYRLAEVIAEELANQ